MIKSSKKTLKKSDKAQDPTTLTVSQTNTSNPSIATGFIADEKSKDDKDIHGLRIEIKKIQDHAAKERASFDETCHILLSQLQNTQEQLEVILNENERITYERDQFKDLFFYTLTKNSDFWLYKTLVIALVDKEDRLEADVNLKDTYINDERFEEIKFRLFVDNGAAGLVFPAAKPGEPSLLKKWTREQLSQQKLCCIPVQGSSFENANAILAGLGTTDWLRVRDLFKKLGHYFEKNIDTIPLGNDLSIQFAKALRNTNEILEAWPKILRYDNVSLENTTDFDNYNALDISLTNALIGDKVVDRFSYTIATTYSSQELLHEHPRLEFPESCKDLVENWFPETQDDRGARLELRFAYPNAMDIEVWHKLSAMDQILVATLLSGAERQLLELEITSELSRLETAAWVDVARTMRKALGDYALHRKKKSGARA